MDQPFKSNLVPENDETNNKTKKRQKEKSDGIEKAPMELKNKFIGDEEAHISYSPRNDKKANEEAKNALKKREEFGDSLDDVMTTIFKA